MTRTNLVDAYDNRSVVAKLVSMEERISGAESSIEKTVEDGEKSIDTMVTAGTTQINSLMTDLKDIKTEATAAASTAETATATANAAVTKAESASATIAANVTACANAAADAQGYATTGKLHDGTAVNSADYLQKLTQTSADAAKTSASQASGYATSASNSATAASQNAASAEASAKAASTSETNAKASADAAAASAKSVTPEGFVQIEGAQTVTGAKALTNTANTMKVASRTTAASAEDVINFGDINAVNGEYNDLVHRSGVETVPSNKIFTDLSAKMHQSKDLYWSSSGAMKIRRFAHIEDTLPSTTGNKTYMLTGIASTSVAITLFALEVVITYDGTNLSCEITRGSSSAKSSTTMTTIGIVATTDNNLVLDFYAGPDISFVYSTSIFSFMLMSMYTGNSRNFNFDVEDVKFASSDRPTFLKTVVLS